jgi:hypothetical protein
MKIDVVAIANAQTLAASPNFRLLLAVAGIRISASASSISLSGYTRQVCSKSFRLCSFYRTRASFDRINLRNPAIAADYSIGVDRYDNLTGVTTHPQPDDERAHRLVLGGNPNPATTCSHAVTRQPCMKPDEHLITRKGDIVAIPPI